MSAVPPPPERYRGFVLAQINDGHGQPYVEVYYEDQFADGAPSTSFAAARAWVDERWAAAGGDPVALDAQFGIYPMPVRGDE